MTKDDHEPYDLHHEHEDEPGVSGPPPPTEAPDPDDEIDLEAIEVEPPPPPSSSQMECPNCGAVMRGRDTLVCLRCGFDLKSLKTISTRTGPAVEAEEEPDEEEETGAPAVSRPGRGDHWLPLGLAAAAGVVLVGGFLLGARGLFPHVDAAAPVEMATRLTALVRTSILIVVMAITGLAGVYVLAYLLGARAGDLRLAAERVLAIAVVMRLMTLLDVGSRSVEWVLEAALQTAVAFGLALFLLDLKPRDGLTYVLVALVILVGTWAAGNAITWAT